MRKTQKHKVRMSNCSKSQWGINDLHTLLAMGVIQRWTWGRCRK